MWIKKQPINSSKNCFLHQTDLLSTGYYEDQQDLGTSPKFLPINGTLENTSLQTNVLLAACENRQGMGHAMVMALLRNWQWPRVLLLGHALLCQSTSFLSVWTANAAHMSLSNLFLANEVSEKQIRLLLTQSLMQPLLCHSQFLKWSYNSAVKNTWCDRTGRWNGLLMSVCANGSWAEQLKSNKLYRFRAQNNFSYITLMSFVMKTNCFVLYKVVPMGAGKFKITQGHF